MIIAIKKIEYGSVPRFLVVFFLLLLLFSHISRSGTVHAQTSPVFMVTWQAEDFAPASFRGKILPIPKTRVTVAMNLVDKNQIIDLSKTEVRWLVNDKLASRGNGLQSFQFVVPPFFTEDQRIRIQIPNYHGIGLDKTVVIPVTLPTVIIQSPYLNNFVEWGVAHLKALPYFFNIATGDNLAFEWSVNQEEPQSQANLAPDELSIEIPSTMPAGSTMTVLVRAENILESTEAAAQKLILTIK